MRSAAAADAVTAGVVQSLFLHGGPIFRRPAASSAGFRFHPAYHWCLQCGATQKWWRSVSPVPCVSKPVTLCWRHIQFRPVVGRALRVIVQPRAGPVNGSMSVSCRHF